jgi:hypothetical protein
LADFSDEDQAYIRSQTGEKDANGPDDSGQARPAAIAPVAQPPLAGRPFDGEAAPAGGAMPGAPPASQIAPQPLRTWTDRFGNSLLARFVRASGTMVVLDQGGVEKTFPFQGFGDADRSYVVGALQARGEAELAARLSASVSTGVGSVPSPSPAGPNSFTPSFDHLRRPSFPPPPIDLNSMGQESRQRAEEMHERMRREAEQRSAQMERERAERERERTARVEADRQRAQRERGEQLAHRTSPAAGSLRPSVASRPASDPTSGSTASSFPGPPRGSETSSAPPSGQEEVGMCSNCKKDVPAHIGAGDRCPHCGITFTFEEKADGTYVDAHGSEVSKWWVNVGGWGGAIFVIFILISIAVRVFGRK